MSFYACTYLYCPCAGDSVFVSVHIHDHDLCMKKSKVLVLFSKLLLI